MVRLGEERNEVEKKFLYQLYKKEKNL